MLNRKRYRLMNDHHDLTFLFDIRESGNIKIIVTDNYTECDVALVDLPEEAKRFCNKLVYELSHKPIIDGIRVKLHKREEVAV